MTKGNNTLLFYYDSDGNVTSFKYGGTMYYYVKNLQCDIVKIINQDGKPNWHYSPKNAKQVIIIMWIPRERFYKNA